jgi:uncharacterized protein YciI
MLRQRARDSRVSDVATEWLYAIRSPRGASFVEDATEAESAVMGEHFAYLQAALEAGRLVLAGPATDGEFPGIVVFEADDEDDARAFMEDDPSVRQGVMLGELHAFRVSLLRGRSGS